MIATTRPVPSVRLSRSTTSLPVTRPERCAPSRFASRTTGQPSATTTLATA
jgi:hypothetical protein